MGDAGGSWRPSKRVVVSTRVSVRRRSRSQVEPVSRLAVMSSSIAWTKPMPTDAMAVRLLRVEQVWGGAGAEASLVAAAGLLADDDFGAAKILAGKRIVVPIFGRALPEEDARKRERIRAKRKERALAAPRLEPIRRRA